MQTIIVIPCYNEARRLPVDVFRTFAEAHPDIGFRLVDDGSSDETNEVLQSLHSARPESFGVVTLEQNRGKAEAVRAGVLDAFEAGPTYVGYWDADLSTSLEEIEPFRDTLAANDDLVAVLGSRVRLLGREVHRTAKRHYAGRVFATCAALTLGLSVYDTQCGAKLFRMTDEVRGLFGEPFLSTWIFDVEILARLARSRRGADGLAIERALAEQPLQAWNDVAGSKLRPQHAFGALIDLWKIRRRYLR